MSVKVIVNQLFVCVVFPLIALDGQTCLTNSSPYLPIKIKTDSPSVRVELTFPATCVFSCLSQRQKPV